MSKHTKVVTFGDRERMQKAADAAAWKYVWLPRERRERSPLRELQRKPLGQIAPLAAPPPVADIGGLYDGRSEEQRRADSRRAADRVLEQYGIRPRKTW